MTRAGAARRGQRDRPRVLRRRHGGQDPGPGGEETDRFAAKAHELRDVNIRAGRIRAAFDPTLAALPNIGVLVVLAVGVVRVLNGQTDAGDVVTVAYLLTIVSFPIRSIGWLLGEFPRSVVGYRRARRCSTRPARWSTATGSLPATAPRGPARGRRLGYAYDPDQPLLDDVTFDVEPGRTVAVVGATASGKSTLTTLLTRLVDPDRARSSSTASTCATWPAARWPRARRRGPADAFLFDDTVRGNVTLGADVSDEEVWAALRTAQADGFVAALPDGLDTRLGERGTSLSGGQRQRISLARALVRRPRLLILDDATSAVDPEVEARILAALRDGGRRHHPGRGRLPQGDHRAGRRGRPPRRRPGRRPRHPRRPAGPQPGVRPTWSTPTSRDPRRAGRRRAGPRDRPTPATRDGHRRGHRRDRHHPPRHGALARAQGGLRVTLVLAVVASVGQVVVPIAVQQTLDRGLNGPDGRPTSASWSTMAASPRWRSW